MKASKLPYNMGNAGDLVKHGMLAEFVEWYLKENESEFVYFDPFAGRPYELPPHPEVSRRMQSIQDCALVRAQSDATNRYYSSSYIVRNIVGSSNRKAVLYVSDRDPAAMKEFLMRGFEPISLDSFKPEDSFSILDCKLPINTASLLLLDPFDDFLPEYANGVIPRLSKFIPENHVYVLLFLLCEDWESEQGKKWQRLNNQYLVGNVGQVILECNRVEGSEVRGESRFHSQAVLLMPPRTREYELDGLLSNLQEFSVKLSKVIGSKVRYDARVVECQQPG